VFANAAFANAAFANARWRRRLLAATHAWALAVMLAVPGLAAGQFDHAHAAWSAMLGRHVALKDGGRASEVDYAGVARERAALKAYLATLSAVAEAEFAQWTKPQRMAFLINAYNAFTVEKVLTRYPDLKSIRDFGQVFGNPWKDRFFTLFGKPYFLDGIEHQMLRAPSVYAEPRLHYALNCASVGCPMLREEAYVAERLDAQLEQQAERFLSDRSRNRFDGDKGVLEVSKIFDWYKEDWTRGYTGFNGNGTPVSSLAGYFARYAALLADQPADRARIADQQVEIRFLEYDWRLNAPKR
jgi:hypothetical protein